ncbi:Toxin co-regulated pilus biosynthesis protein Q [compost metagenome]
MDNKSNISFHKKNALALAMLAVMCGITSTAAIAELYVSPVVSSSQPGGFDPIAGAPTAKPAAPTSFVSANAQAQAVANAVKAAGAPVPLPVGSALPTYKPVVVPATNSKFLNSPSGASQVAAAPVMKYGKNIPLSVVFDKLVPKYEGWTVNMEDGIGTKKVSWNGGNTWKEVLSKISNENGFTIVVNEAEKAIGVSSSMVLAESLAHKQNQIWKIESGKGLRENLTAWATKAGWKIQWDENLDVDYPITNSAVLVGPFAGKGGVIDRVIYSLRNKDRPLTAVFYTGNNVVLIKDAGFKQSNGN